MSRIPPSALRRIGYATIGILILGAGAWHVLTFRFAVAEFNVAVGANNLPPADSLAAASIDNFTAALTTLPAALRRSDALDQDRQHMVDDMSWLQRLFVSPPDEAHKAAFDTQVASLIPALPDLAAAQTSQLTEQLLAAAAGGGDVRDAAAMYKARRKALIHAATSVDSIAAVLTLGDVATVEAVNSDRVGLLVEQWIDQAAAREVEALEVAQEAMAAAQRAGRASARLQRDAPSREIRPVVVAWQGASSIAQEAVRIANRTPSDRRARPLVQGLLTSAGEKTGAVKAEVDANLRTIRGAYEAARSEEATVLGALSRFGRRTARRVREFAASTAQQLDRHSGELSAALSTGLSQAALASSDVLDRGIRAYEDSRKPPLQRYVESKEGITAIAIGVLLLLALTVGLSVAIRASAAEPNSGERLGDSRSNT